MSRDTLNKEIEKEFSNYLRKNISIDDFTILNLKGRGAYGSVLIVKENKTGIVYFMRILNKKDMLVYNQKLLIKGNRPILELIDFPLISKLDIVFHNKQKVYLLGKYNNVEELTYKAKTGMKENEIKSIAAQLVLAIEHLHKRNIIFRYITSENILLESNGFIKLTDFGLNNELIENDQSKTRKLSSFTKATKYSSPEIFNRSDYSFASDWWSYGVLIYEILNGYFPFTGNSREEIHNNVEKGEYKRDTLTSDYKEFFSLLFIEDITKRLENISKIKQLKLFEQINWEELQQNINCLEKV